MTTDLEPAEIVDAAPPPGALIRQAGTTREIAQAISEYHDLCSRVLDKTDFQRIGPKDFPKKSAWRKLAVAFGVSCSYLERNYERDAEGRIVAAEVVVRATAPNGRYMDGVGLCHIGEARFARGGNPYHDIPATAATRATNRACSDLFGMGEVSAEEIVESDPPPVQAKVLRKVTQAGPPGMGDVSTYVDEDTGEKFSEDEVGRRKLNAERAGLFKALSNQERIDYDAFRSAQGIALTKAGKAYTLAEALACDGYLRGVLRGVLESPYPEEGV